MLDILSGALAGLGILQSGNQQRSANNLSREALDMQKDAYYNYQKPSLELSNKISQMILASVQGAMDSGAYDFDKIQKNLELDMSKIRAQSMKDIGAGLSLAGYRPGDTAGGDAIARGNREITEDFTSQSRGLRMQLPMMLAQALSAAAAPASAAAGASSGFAANMANGLNNAANQKNQQAGNPAGMLAGILDYFGQQNAAMPGVNLSSGLHDMGVTTGSLGTGVVPAGNSPLTLAA